MAAEEINAFCGINVGFRSVIPVDLNPDTTSMRVNDFMNACFGKEHTDDFLMKWFESIAT